jgi:hypothetical protein
LEDHLLRRRGAMMKIKRDTRRRRQMKEVSKKMIKERGREGGFGGKGLRKGCVLSASVEFGRRRSMIAVVIMIVILV